MSPGFEELSARLLAMETVLGHLVVRLAVRDDDPLQWLATRRILALRAAQDVEQQSGADFLAHAVSDAIVEFFDGVERAIEATPDAGLLPHARQ